MALVNSICNYYFMTYGSKPANRCSTHKKSELRDIYNSMVKINKESPLYKIKENSHGDMSKFAIDVKESARALQNVTQSLGDSSDAFKKKVAMSTDEDVVSVKYIGDGSDHALLNTQFDIEIQSLAKSQINLGRFLPSKGHSLIPGKYSFDFDTNSASFEFQFSVNADDTNLTVQNKIASLMNSANVGVTASIVENENSQTALRIESKDTGLSHDEEFLFRISAEDNRDSRIAMEVLDIGFVAREACSSSFLIDGESHSSLSNTFTLNNQFELTLNGISAENSPATIGFKNDVDAIADNLSGLLNCYNHIINISEQYTKNGHTNSKLGNEFRNVVESQRSELDSMGLMVQENGSIQIDRALLGDAVSDPDNSEPFEVLNHFKNLLQAKSRKMTLNPIDYVDKVVVAYKNPGKTFNTPYVSSLYSGMMLDCTY